MSPEDLNHFGGVRRPAGGGGNPSTWSSVSGGSPAVPLITHLESGIAPSLLVAEEKTARCSTPPLPRLCNVAPTPRGINPFGPGPPQRAFLAWARESPP